MLTAARVFPAGPGGRDVDPRERRTPTHAPAGRISKLRDYYAYRNAIPALFKGEERFRGLSPAETSVLATLLRRARAEYEGRCWPTHEQLVQDLHGGISVRHLTRVVASLRDKGWLMIETTHAAQRLPNGRAVVGGERNVYRPNLVRVLGGEPAKQDGQDGVPRMDAVPTATAKIAEEIAPERVGDPDQDLDQHTDPQRDAPEERAVTSTMEIARMLLAHWAQTAFPDAPASIDVAAGPEGAKRVARVVGLLERGFPPELLGDAILGATRDTYVRAAGCPLGLVLGDKVLHYAELGAAARRSRERERRRAEAARRDPGLASARAAPEGPAVTSDEMRADLERVFGGAA